MMSESEAVASPAGATAPPQAAPTRPRRRGPWIALALALVALAGGAAWYGLGRSGGKDGGVVQSAPGMVGYREGQLRYDYHIVSGTESLCDLGPDPRCAKNVLRERPGDGRRLRQALELKLGLSSLDELRSGDREKIERLKGLGYL